MNGSRDEREELPSGLLEVTACAPTGVMACSCVLAIEMGSDIRFLCVDLIFGCCNQV